MRRFPHHRPAPDIHLLDVWLRSGREPLLSFARLLGGDGSILDTETAGALEVYLYCVVRGCLSASILTSGSWYREEGDGDISVPASLTFRSVDELIIFKEEAEA